MNKFRIGYLGDGPWASKALTLLAELKDEIEIVFVMPRFDKLDPILEKLSTKIGCKFEICQNINSSENLTKLASYQLDLLVSMSFNQIMKSGFIATARYGVINCHAGALPKYRGRNVLNWALINGEKELGITVHYVDEGIDTGDIINQVLLPITPKDNYATLLKKSYSKCAELLIKSVLEIKSRTANRKPQILTDGFYCSRRREGDEWIDWNWSSSRVHNFIRGISDPGPGATFAIGEQVFSTHHSVLVENPVNYIGTSGEIIGHYSDGVLVKTGDSIIGVSDCCMLNKKNEKFRPKWSIGTRLKNRLEFRVSQLETTLAKIEMKNKSF